MLGAEQDVAVSRSTFTLPDANNHPLAIDIGHLQLIRLRAAESGRIQSHQHGPVHETFFADATVAAQLLPD